MTAYLLRDAAGVVRPCRMGGSSGHSGATGEIFTLQDDAASCAKIYHDAAFARRMAPKIETMLRRPPDHLRVPHGGRDYHQLAWPTAVVQRADGMSAGFVMPLIPFTETVSLESVLTRAARQRTNVREAWSFRLSVARNLAGLVASIHQRQHLLVDIKPLNFRVYRDLPFVCALDTDGFTIAGDVGARYPAEHISEPYIAPESQHRLPEQADIHQDRFALAALIFQIVNNGIHPYQGRAANDRVPTTAQDKVYGGYYAYGPTPKDITPAPLSIHRVLDADTRALFDRAFAPSPAGRPSAADWHAHLSEMSRAPRLRPCPVQPGHVRLAAGCPSCEYERLAGGMPPSVSTKDGAASAPLPKPPATPLPVGVPRPPPPWGVALRRAWRLARFVVPVVAVATVAILNDRSPPRTLTPPPRPSPTIPAPAPTVPSAAPTAPAPTMSAPTPAPSPTAPQPDTPAPAPAVGWPALVSSNWVNAPASPLGQWSILPGSTGCTATVPFANGLTLGITILKNVIDRGGFGIVPSGWNRNGPVPTEGSSRGARWWFSGLRDKGSWSSIATYRDGRIVVSSLAQREIAALANATVLFVEIDGVTAAFSMAGSAAAMRDLYACTGQQ